MKVGIMQPYFMPYIGYWQLMNAVDKYVVYDDVNYIKGGWINRNRVLMDETLRYINLPILGGSPNKLINEIVVNKESKLFNANIQNLNSTYGNAPYFKETMALIQAVFEIESSNIAEYLKESFYIVGEYLDIHTELILSSQIQKNNTLRGQDKVLEICKKLEATEYYNAVGGQALYQAGAFAKEGIKLNFLHTNPITYEQLGNEFHPNLSIIDVLMFNSREEVQSMLKEFTVISE